VVLRSEVSFTAGCRFEILGNWVRIEMSLQQLTTDKLEYWWTNDTVFFGKSLTLKGSFFPSHPITS